MRGNDSPIGVKNRQDSIGEGARQATMQVYAPGEGRRETGSNKFLPERDTVERAWDPDTMIWNARSLQTVAKQLASGRVTPAEDVFLFTGQQLAEPILLALATEIALKAWQCRERKGPPESEHDLLKLFEGLSEEARGRPRSGLPRAAAAGRHAGLHPDSFRRAQDTGDPPRHVRALALRPRDHERSRLPAGAGRGTDRDNRSLRSIPLVISTRCEIDGPRPSSGRGPRDTPSPQL